MLKLHKILNDKGGYTMCSERNNNGNGRRLPYRPKCYRRKRENNSENVQYRSINERVEESDSTKTPPKER